VDDSFAVFFKQAVYLTAQDYRKKSAQSTASCALG
jgi:hypothetical protein